MKFRSVLKKLKPKKKKSAFDGVVKDDDKKQSTFRGESEEMSPSKTSVTKKSIGSKPQMVQRGPSDESSSSYSHLYRKQPQANNNNRIQSEVQQQTKQVPMMKTRSQQRPVVQAPIKNKASPQQEKKNQSSFNPSFQDDFGVAGEPTTWASFGNSSGFFHQNQSSASLFTDNTAPESESSLSSPSNSRNSSFESTKSSEELISSQHSRSRRASPPASRGSLSSSPNETFKPPQEAIPPPPPPPTQERRSDRSLPMPEALQVGANRDQRQRASPTTTLKKTPSPVQSPALNKSLYSVQTQESSPSPSPVSKRRSITDRYTAALNTSAAAQSPVARKLFATPSKTSVLDNHPMFRKRSMVEQEELPTSKVEEREMPEAKLGNKTASSNSLVGLEQAKIQQESPPAAQSPTSDEPKEDVAAAVVTDQDSVHAPSEEGAVEPLQASPEQATLEAPEDETDQVEASQEATPQASQVEQLEDEMPILSRVQSSVANNDSTPQFSTVDTVASSVAQSSKATTVSGVDDESDTETAPIGELSFDSNSNHETDAEEEETLDYTYDPDGVSLLSEDFTDYSQYHELKRKHRFSNWVENTIFGMANFMCPMEEGDVYDA